ncbi:MAG TPA: ATP-binding protein [Aquabacterium sp.]|uniref:ATP-binding protein n=1 Tax=Aquabacterium sp. TaxID=1872578 RepID=UPI002E32192B|nr:ATP-binding protein [Aquabacterium sp.]HEX5357347.1 ATP-binding protein [Aquabacterium sp.]
MLLFQSLAHPPHKAARQALRVNNQVETEQLQMVWAHARIGVVVASAFAVALAWSLRGQAAPAIVVDAWLASKLLVSAFRIVQGSVYAHQRQAAAHWGLSTLLALMLDGVIWGAAGLYVSALSPQPYPTFFVAALACISCVATFGLQVSARFTAAYAAPILAPTALGMMLRGDTLSELGGLGLWLLLGLQIATAMRSERGVVDGIQLRLHAQALAHEKEEALKTAVRQSAVKTQFLANISHELRTPLHGILGMSKLLHLAEKDPTALRRIELIEASGTHLLALINDLLDISRIEAGQFLIRHERHDLSMQIEQLVGIYTMRAEDKGLAFEVRGQLPSPCWVMGDPARFRQVLHNLLGNAIKFTQQGRITLTIARDPVSGMVRAEVHDTGCGIPPADLDKIFEAFQQSTSSSADQAAQGAGLGLTIARDIARAMKGDITARSVVGEGTTMVFTACLPDATHGTAEAPLSAEDAFQGSRHCRVLLAEDNEINALVAMNFLEIIGVDAERVPHGADALSRALRTPHRPDIVLMDCHMPVLNGYEATRMIRLKERELGLRRLPIVALTATTTDAERQDCLAAGMDDFLSKPCTLEDLGRVIKQWAGETLKPPGAVSAPDEPPRDASPADPRTSLQT